LFRLPYSPPGALPGGGEGTTEDDAMVKITLEGELTLLDLQAREYRIAFMLESDGSFEVVERFMAVNDGGANAYAETYYGDREWYVLDDTGRNINGGDQA